MHRRAAIVLAVLCWRTGLRSEREARVAALEACERTGDSCSIYAVDDDLETDRARARVDD